MLPFMGKAHAGPQFAHFRDSGLGRCAVALLDLCGIGTDQQNYVARI
jgi:hypothetical protein